ncbi:MAG: hypothetical protein JO205_06410 [Pseudolabrys sp.]|nr:hypothetical protein [Pseudolabrys sp.]
MVAVTYGVARAAAGALKSKPRKRTASKGGFARFWNALMEARLKQAQRELALHRFGREDEPFGGW